MSDKHITGIRITAREDGAGPGGFLVERLYCGEVRDHYVTRDLSAPRRDADRYGNEWKARVAEFVSGGSAGIEIAVPPVPPLEPPMLDRLWNHVVELENDMWSARAERDKLALLLRNALPDQRREFLEKHEPPGGWTDDLASAREFGKHVASAMLVVDDADEDGEKEDA